MKVEDMATKSIKIPKTEIRKKRFNSVFLNNKKYIFKKVLFSSKLFLLSDVKNSTIGAIEIIDKLLRITCKNTNKTREMKG
tara:strand:- start:279 stop:521 length:243 start_codon:yes stop_codon:yes gene_type:complete